MGRVTKAGGLAGARGVAADELRRHNLGAILEHLHLTGPATRSQLTSVTGLNRSTVGDLIGELADAAYSRIFDLKPDFAHSLGNTFHPVAPHTDEAYLHNPTGIQVLYCLHPADEGGDTILVDGFKLATELKRCDPGAFDLLKSQPQTFMRVVPDDGVSNPASMRSSVDLPQPEPPSRQKSSPL